MNKVTEQQLMSATSLLREYIAVVEADDLVTVDGEAQPRSELEARRNKLQQLINNGQSNAGGVEELKRINTALGGSKTPAATPAPQSPASPPKLITVDGEAQTQGDLQARRDFLQKNINSLGAGGTEELKRINAALSKEQTPAIKAQNNTNDWGTDPEWASAAGTQNIQQTVQNNNTADWGPDAKWATPAATATTGGSGKKVTTAPAAKAPAAKAPAAKAPAAKPDPTVMFQQQELNKRGAGLTVNGIKDQKTINALKQYNSGKLTPYVDPGSAQGQALRQQSTAPKPEVAPRPTAPRTNSVDSAMGSFATESSYSDVPTLARITQLAGL
jgi:hypothetical protein